MDQTSDSEQRSSFLVVVFHLYSLVLPGDEVMDYQDCHHNYSKIPKNICHNYLQSSVQFEEYLLP